jgi:hypothetical protein
MVERLSIGGLPTDEQIEREGDKMLTRLLKGGRVHLVGIDAPNHAEHGPDKPCDVCGSGKRLETLESQREHGLCLSCMRGTKHFQRCVEKVLRTMEERRRFCLSVKTAELKMRANRQRMSRAGARPNEARMAFIKSLIEKS